MNYPPIGLRILFRSIGHWLQCATAWPDNNSKREIQNDNSLSFACSLCRPLLREWIDFHLFFHCYQNQDKKELLVRFQSIKTRWECDRHNYIMSGVYWGQSRTGKNRNSLQGRTGLQIEQKISKRFLCCQGRWVIAGRFLWAKWRPTGSRVVVVVVLVVAILCLCSTCVSMVCQWCVNGVPHFSTIFVGNFHKNVRGWTSRWASLGCRCLHALSGRAFVCLALDWTRINKSITKDKKMGILKGFYTIPQLLSIITKFNCFLDMEGRE